MRTSRKLGIAATVAVLAAAMFAFPVRRRRPT
jgi:hypothetical protein